LKNIHIKLSLDNIPFEETYLYTKHSRSIPQSSFGLLNPNCSRKLYRVLL